MTSRSNRVHPEDDPPSRNWGDTEQGDSDWGDPGKPSRASNPNTVSVHDETEINDESNTNHRAQNRSGGHSHGNDIKNVSPVGSNTLYEDESNDNVRSNNFRAVAVDTTVTEEPTVHVKAESHATAVDVTLEEKVFNKREAWTPHLWQRKRDKSLVKKVNPTKGFAGWKYRNHLRWHSFKMRLRDLASGMELWRKSLKRIEGFQGTGVVSYFVFLKVLLFLNIFIALLMFWVVVFEQLVFDESGYPTSVTGVADSSTHSGVTLATTCSAQYSPEVSSDEGQLILDFFQGTGWMEKTSFFYGYYSNKALSTPKGDFNMALAYYLAVAVVLFVSFLVIVQYALTTHIDTLVSYTEKAMKANYFNDVFGRWEFSVIDPVAVPVQQQSFYNKIAGDIEKQKHKRARRSRSRGEKCRLYFQRFLVNLVVLCIFVGAFVSVYYAQQWATGFTTGSSADSAHPLKVFIVEYFPSLVMEAFIIISPVFFNILTKFEHYAPDFVVKITIVRVVVVRIGALAVDLAAIYVSFSCTPADTCLVGTGECPAVECWETYVGQQIYKLIIVEFLTDVILTLVIELPRNIICKRSNNYLLKKLGPPEFEIAIAVLDLAYAQTLCWIGFVFAPLMPVMCVIRTVLTFYLKKISALYGTVPPEKPYYAARSNVFFMGVLILAFLLVLIPIIYTVEMLQPSPMCGPFRIYDRPSDIVGIQIDQSASWFRWFWSFISSGAFLVALIVFMVLALHYCSTVRAASQKLVVHLKTQLLQEEKEKQMWMKITQKTQNVPFTSTAKSLAQFGALARRRSLKKENPGKQPAGLKAF